nr:MAG TPA: Maltose-binding periplasmic protein,Mitochondrial import receptor protein complex, SUGAR BINDING [Caudoviricetes sp.]
MDHQQTQRRRVAAAGRDRKKNGRGRITVPGLFLFPRLCDQCPHKAPDQIQIRICGQPQQALDLFQQQIPFHFHKCLHSSTKNLFHFCILLPLRFASICFTILSKIFFIA